jgi:transcriptional regulator with XRE-family HTH domain
MGRNRKSQQPAEVPAICARFDWILKREFGNSITTMARALGVSHTTLSRTLNKGQMPSGEMLVALARLHRVNLEWLLSDGSHEQLERAQSFQFVPIVSALLPGPLERHPALVTPLGMPISSPYRLESPYLFRVSDDSAIARSGEKIAPGDYLLIETGETWTSRESAYIHRLVILCDASGMPHIGRVDRDEDFFSEDRQFQVETFGVFEQAQLKPDCRRKDARINSRKTKSRNTSVEIFFGDDVVGVVVQLIRM